MSKRTEQLKAIAANARQNYINDITASLTKLQAGGWVVPPEDIPNLETFLALSLYVIQKADPMLLQQAGMYLETKQYLNSREPTVDPADKFDTSQISNPESYDAPEVAEVKL